MPVCPGNYINEVKREFVPCIPINYIRDIGIEFAVF